MEYDWLPVKCSCCKGFGHVEVDCRKKQESWTPKTVEPVPNTVKEIGVNKEKVVVAKQAPLTPTSDTASSSEVKE